jgi:hypothetical protein
LSLIYIKLNNSIKNTVKSYFINKNHELTLPAETINAKQVRRIGDYVAVLEPITESTHSLAKIFVPSNNLNAKNLKTKSVKKINENLPIAKFVKYTKAGKKSATKRRRRTRSKKSTTKRHRHCSRSKPLFSRHRRR